VKWKKQADRVVKASELGSHSTTITIEKGRVMVVEIDFNETELDVEKVGFPIWESFQSLYIHS
jgi:hypothetical protein